MNSQKTASSGGEGAGAGGSMQSLGYLPNQLQRQAADQAMGGSSPFPGALGQMSQRQLGLASGGSMQDIGDAEMMDVSGLSGQQDGQQQFAGASQLQHQQQGSQWQQPTGQQAGWEWLTMSL